VTEAAHARAFGPNLIKRIAGGEEQALAELYDQTSRMVYGYVLSIVGDAAIAEEVTLEVYLQVWRTASTYSPERCSVNAWLAAAAHIQALNRLRDVRGTLGEYREVE
jgi:RNA polymerase sigma-70 factor (ECF subfamily)